jgi:hypothetical protein
MNAVDQGEQWRPHQPPPAKHCPKCANPVRFAMSLLDVRNDKFVRVYRCDPCQKEIWDE